MGERKRLARVEVSPELLASWLVEGAAIRARCTEGVPEDAKFESALIDPATMCISLYFSHPSFMPVPAGGHVPVHGVVVEE